MCLKNALRKISHSDGLGLRCIILEDCYNEVKEPDLAKCAKRKDFGQGFYLRLLSLILPELMEELRLSVAGTLAWDLSGNRDESSCIDIDPFTVYELESINNLIA